MGIAHITSNDWELLFVLSRRGHGNISPSHWVRLDLVDSILTGSIKANTIYFKHYLTLLICRSPEYSGLRAPDYAKLISVDCYEE